VPGKAKAFFQAADRSGCTILPHLQRKIKTLRAGD
jgi:hypothetical protein